MLPTTTAANPALTPAAASPARSEAQFFVRVAYVCAAIAIIGFVPSFWLPAATGSFGGSAVLHLHGLLFTAWTLLFIAQARLAASERYERHRLLGYAGISIATGMLFLGVMATVQAIESATLAGFEQRARAFSIVPITIILFFAAAIAAAIASVRRPEVHMRLMVVASVSLLTPAIARLLFLVLAGEGAPRPGMGSEPPPVAFSLLPSFLGNVVLVAAMVRDWRVYGRPHRVYVIAGAALVAVQVLRVPLSATAAWHAVTMWLSPG